MAWLGVSGAAAVIGAYYTVNWMTNHGTQTPVSAISQKAHILEERQKLQEEQGRSQALQVLAESMGRIGSGPALDLELPPEAASAPVRLATPNAPPVMVPARAVLAALPPSQQARAAQVILAARAQGQTATVVIARRRRDPGDGPDLGGHDLPTGVTISGGGGTISFHH
jgi:hypothetical protein